MMIVNMNHVSFTVSNLDESMKFYKDILGLELISLAERDEDFSSRVSGIEGAKLNIAYMQAPNCAIELIEYTSGKGCRLDTSTNNIGSTHVCFHVDDFDGWIKRMEANNVRYRGEICEVPAGPNKGRRVVYMMDNDGNNLEFIEEIG